jgi:hypothetical protein
MGTWPDHAWLRPLPNARKKDLDLGAERLERRLQQQVLLEAIAAASPADELALDILERKRDGHPPVRIEILERDGRDMRTMDLPDARTTIKPDPL